METAVTIELVIAGAAILTAALVGYRAQGWLGAGMLAIGALFASVFCLGGTVLGLSQWEAEGGWGGLIAGILLIAVLAWLAGTKLLRGKAGWFAAGLWLGFCGLCIFGYLAGGWIGLLTLTLPALAIFWYGLYRISAYILPLQDKKQQQSQAYRSLLTFTMGTNYPYYYARQGELQEQVEGNVFNQLFAGPGIVLADCDQVAYRTDGISAKELAEPGVTFTGKFELEPKVVDLRPQLCAFYVDAQTKDGISVSVMTFVPFRIQRGRRVPKIGEAFPFRPHAIYQAVAREPVDRRARKESEQQLEWNSGVVPMVTTRVLQDLLSRYTIDELCAAHDPTQDPRQEITSQLESDLNKALKAYGLEVLEPWIADLSPQDRCVRDRRIENWQTEWERQLLLELSEGEVERARQMEQARAEAEAEVVLRLGRIMEQSLTEGTASQTALALRFIDCLGEIVTDRESQWAPPPAAKEILDRLRGDIAPGRC